VNIEIKKLERKYMNQVIDLVKRISPYSPSIEMYDDIWFKFNQQNNVYPIIAINDGLVLGYGTLSTEFKIRGGKIGHIEDIVIDQNYERKGLGKKILDALYEIAKTENCLKIMLQCTNTNTKFYEKCGFIINGLAMQKFIK
jgi:glucosamine-phosphate N-acetyltransferase|tara:strand:+ start:6343 stop:6765 length:423 start_codon:yes stop_codon:yes gene_type:complete